MTRHLNMPNVDLIRQQVEALIREYPELQEDETLKLDMLEGSTTFVEALRELECRRQEAVEFAAGIASHITELETRLGRFERREKHLRELLLRLLQAGNLRKVELPEATLSVRPCPPRVIINDDANIPDYYWRVKREIDKTLVKAALKAGDTVPGCALSNQPDTINIRTS